jgi:hypothetical protein
MCLFRVPTSGLPVDSLQSNSILLQRNSNITETEFQQFQWRFGSRAACITLAGTSILLRNVSRIENVVARVATLDPFWGYEAKCHLQVLMLCICNFV